VPAVSQSWSLIRLRLEPVPSLTILEANSTPMVCEERMRPGTWWDVLAMGWGRIGEVRWNMEWNGGGVAYIHS
jgi:hypothetical protein